MAKKKPREEGVVALVVRLEASLLAFRNKSHISPENHKDTTLYDIIRDIGRLQYVENITHVPAQAQKTIIQSLQMCVLHIVRIGNIEWFRAVNNTILKFVVGELSSVIRTIQSTPGFATNKSLTLPREQVLAVLTSAINTYEMVYQVQSIK